MNRRVFALLVLVFVLRPLPSVPADTGADEIARHIRQLGSNDYGERDTASKALAVIGEPALPGLRDATNSADAEVKRRATALVSEINGHTADRVRAPFIALVAKVGGRVTFGWDADDRMTVCVDLAGTAVTDADVKGLGKWSEMRELDLSGTNVTDDTLASLRSASGLRQLKLDDVAVTDCGLPALQGVTLLYALVVSPKTRITDKAVTELQNPCRTRE